MDTRGRVYDAIDLTLSSPEPEQKPSQPRRSQAQHHYKRAPQTYKVASVKSEVGHPATVGQINAPRQQTRVINPHHLRQIVNTSDSRALRKVLLHLCHISPALSGAIARGLAPHSTFAQSIINRHRNTTVATVQSDKDSDDSAYERTERRLTTASGSLKTSQSLAVKRDRHVSQELPQRHSAPKVKSEPRSNLDLSATSSHSIQRAASSASASWDTPKTPAAANRHTKTPLASIGSSSIKREPVHKQKCIQCRESFRADYDDVCVYHAGQRVQRDNQAVWDCCSAPLHDVGCQFGLHIAAEASRDDADNRKRPSASPRPPDEERKRARWV